MKPLVIGVAGTAKNTGKTTTTKAVMDQVKKDTTRILGLTSIGYDGEEIDNVTGLPKPRIEVWPGVLAAVAEKCIHAGSAKMEILEKTHISTPLGKVVLVRITHGGQLLVAGPNKSRELRQVVDLLKNYGANFIIVDGALNRIAPMVEVDGLILATGAARTPDINQLALETRNIVETLQLPIIQTEENTAAMDCVFDIASADKLLENLKKRDKVFINGIISTSYFDYLSAKDSLIKDKHLVFSDPIKLLVCGEISTISKILFKLKEKGLHIGVKKSIQIIAITVNPYYPQFRFTSDDYTEAFVDKELLYSEIAKNIDVPVYDVVKEGGAGIYQDILNYAKVEV
ncbi:MAG: hypothetical protein ACOYVD_19595 [Bacillota bacterium]